MSKPKKCERCEGAGEYWCCDPGTYMCPGLIPCKTCEGSGKVVVVTVKQTRPYSTRNKSNK